MGEVAANEHDAGCQQRAHDAGRPGTGSRRCRCHPAAARGKCLRCDREAVRAELGGMPPEAIVGWQERATGAFVVNVVEVINGFDHGP